MKIQTPSQAAEVFPLIRQLRPHLTEPGFLALHESAAREGYRLVGIYEGDRCVGAMGYRIIHDLLHGKHLYVDDLVVDEGLRSRRIGPRLLAHAETVAREAGCTGLRLCTGIDHGRGRAFYEREGWLAKAVAFKKSF